MKGTEKEVNLSKSVSITIFKDRIVRIPLEYPISRDSF